MSEKSGFYRESFFDYIKGEGINRSFLHEMIDHSAGHAQWGREHQEITEPLRLGDAFHASGLEPERFAKEYVLLPNNCKPGTKDNPNKGMKANKEAFEAKCAANNQTIITQQDSDNIREMAAVIQADQGAIDLLSNGESEISGYFEDPNYPGILIKIRLDWINKEERIIVDLKSCADGRKFPFRASAYKHGYDLQAYMGLYGVTQVTGEAHSEFRFICVESKGFHGLTIYRADDKMLNTGYKKYIKAMNLYRECLETDKWPGYDSACQDLGSPDYATNDEIVQAIYD